jgi:hypothetical protein
METAASRNQSITRPEIQMIGVAQEDLGAEVQEISMGDAFHRALRPDGHERRRLDVAVRRRHHAAARTLIGVGDAKEKGSVGHREASNSLQSEKLDHGEQGDKRRTPFLET